MDTRCYVIGMWAEVSEDIEEDMELLGFFADVDDDVADFHDGIDSFLSTISYFYYAILLISFYYFCNFNNTIFG